MNFINYDSVTGSLQTQKGYVPQTFTEQLAYVREAEMEDQQAPITRE